MNKQISLFSDLKSILFSPRIFFSQRVLQISSQRIFAMSFLCLMTGLILGGALPYFVAAFVQSNFDLDANAYLPALASLNIDKDEFRELLKVQRAYGILLVFLSPMIAYMAPHLFGGALFASLKVLVKKADLKFDFFRVMEASALGLCPMFFYGVPLIGPLVAPVMAFIYTSMALKAQYKLTGFMKTMSIIFAMYVCFFLPSASLQLLALPFAKWLNF